MDNCNEERFLVAVLYSVLMVPCLILQTIVVKIIWRSRIYRDSISFDTILRQSLINLVFVLSQVPLIGYSLFCTSFPVVDQYIILVYLTMFYAIEPYGLVLTLSRINIIAMRDIIPEIVLKILNALIWPVYMISLGSVTVLPNSNCTLYYYVYNWETSKDCVHQDLLNGMTKSVYIILGFNLAAYLVISTFLMVQRPQSKHSARKSDLKAEQRVLLSTMSSFFSSFVLITGKLGLSEYVNDVTAARIVYRVLVLLSNNVFVFSLVFVNTFLRKNALKIILGRDQKLPKNTPKMAFQPTMNQFTTNS